MKHPVVFAILIAVLALLAVAVLGSVNPAKASDTVPQSIYKETPT
jgi:hypothetical protein